MRMTPRAPSPRSRRAFQAALAAAILTGAPAPAGAPPAGPAPGVESLLRAVPDAAVFERHLRHLTEEPHQTGTPRDLELAAYVRDRFREYGLDEVSYHDTPALIPYGRSAALAIVAPLRMTLDLAEDPHPEDKDSHLYRDPAVVPFHGYAADGDVTGEVVYANSGGPEDFAALDRMGIDVKGRIVLMRYSEPYSYRGYKVYLAETRGAAGTLIYSDPQDDGYVRGPVYPEGPWGPASHVQWGAIIYDWLGPGEPLTFHWTRRGGRWTEGPARDRKLPRIPSLPISHRNAAEILGRLRGPAVPSGWQGGLPFTYRVGPGPVKVRLQVDNDERIATIRNVIGVIRGRSEPERRVIAGNHRDAWIYGAVDPSSGTAALLELARALGAALREGHRPRRTIVLANWGAEEELLGGSTAWVQDHARRLRKDGVAYINVDSAAAGPRFEGGASPSLARFLIDATRAVADPESGRPLHDVWAAASSSGTPEVQTIVGATDYTAFLEHVGMSCIDMSFWGPYGVYHSMYDNFFWLGRIGDPGFRYNVTLARLWTTVAWRLADAEILPHRHSDHVRAVAAALDAVEKRLAGRGVSLHRARAALRRWEESAAAFEARLDALRAAAGAGVSAPARAAAGVAGVPTLPPGIAREINRLLIDVERAMTDDRGLRDRPFFKHLIYAPQPTYREMVLPRVWEAIDRGDWQAVPRHIRELESAFARAASSMRDAAGLLTPDAS
jgi:N-acetylated-alpha-linked acidic dipeptidase